MRILMQFEVWAYTMLGPLTGQQNDIEQFRVSYLRSVQDKTLCRQLIDQLERTDKNPVQLAYLGALKAIWAKHVVSPIAKLNTFNKGRVDIETAVARAPENLEVRLLRLSVQSNSPFFLGYKGRIEEDGRFIHTNQNSITSVQLKKMIAEIKK